MNLWAPAHPVDPRWALLMPGASHPPTDTPWAPCSEAAQPSSRTQGAGCSSVTIQESETSQVTLISPTQPLCACDWVALGRKTSMVGGRTRRPLLRRDLHHSSEDAGRFPKHWLSPGSGLRTGRCSDLPGQEALSAFWFKRQKHL